ncbi:magnesium/cobalt transporter CorA [Candidatus Woesearchaeota archaeon]|nr:magnesium/cobalt transporter CorA [Candidatus Woesearchaeota archaeon]
MIRVWQTRQGKLEISGLDGIRKGNTLVWIDANRPSAQEMRRLAILAGVPTDEIRHVVDDEERPRAMDVDEAAEIIVRVPYKSDAGIITTSVAVMVRKNIVMTLRNTPVVAISRIEEYPPDKKLQLMANDHTYFLYRFLQEVMADYFQVTERLEEEVDLVEDRVIRSVSRELLVAMFQVKKTLIYFQRALTGNRDVILSIETGLVKNMGAKHNRYLRYVYNDTAQLIDSITTYRDILTGTLDLYLSSVSNSLNNIMKKLTVYASFVLVPTLIAGIYGMNFKAFPELGWKYGLLFSYGIMIASVVSLYIFFKRKNYI